MNEAHNSLLSTHSGSTKMYQDLKQAYWWTRMKREIAQFVNECDVCRRVKAEHPDGLLLDPPSSLDSGACWDTGDGGADSGLWSY